MGFCERLETLLLSHEMVQWSEQQNNVGRGVIEVEPARISQIDASESVL